MNRAAPLYVDRKAATALIAGLTLSEFDMMAASRPGFPRPAFEVNGRAFWRWLDIEECLAGSPQGVNAGTASAFQRAIDCEKGRNRAAT